MPRHLQRSGHPRTAPLYPGQSGYPSSRDKDVEASFRDVWIQVARAASSSHYAAAPSTLGSGLMLDLAAPVARGEGEMHRL